MAPLIQKQYELSKQEVKLYKELDKGIDDMERGRTIPHDEAIKQISERIRLYGV